jgi:hypothetical protein
MHKHSSVLLALALFSWVSTGITGEVIEFSGKFVLRTDELSRDIIGNQVCFYPTAETAHRAPRDKNDMRTVWFCFSNTETAMNIFSIPSIRQNSRCGFEGTADVSVSQYVVYRDESSGNDRAKLVGAKAISTSTNIPCE